jgi:hypothetical protein
MMKNFTGASFFRTFDLLIGVTNPGAKLTHWVVEGVDCERERHSFAGANYGFAIEVFRLTRSARRGWGILVVREFWWRAQASDPLKRVQWARPTEGRRNNILGWSASRKAGSADRRPVLRGPDEAPATRRSSRQHTPAQVAPAQTHARAHSSARGEARAKSYLSGRATSTPASCEAGHALWNLRRMSVGERMPARRNMRQRRWPSESPIAWAFWRSAPAVRFMALAMAVTGVFLRE